MMKKNGLIRDFASIENLCAPDKPVIVLYSGGLDGSYLLAKLQELHFSNVIAFHLPLTTGSNTGNIEDVCRYFNTSLVIEQNAVEEFVNDFVIKAIQAQAKYLNLYPISASLSRPFISLKAVLFAQQNNIGTIIHSSDKFQNSLTRFNNSIKGCGFDGLYGSPYESEIITRQDKLKLIRKMKFDIKWRDYSIDENIWCREFESGKYSDIENIPLVKSDFLRTNEDHHLHETILKISFKEGIPIKINDQNFSPVNIIDQLNKIGGKYGVGRYIGIEQRNNGTKVLEIREAPAAHLLLDAYKNLEMCIIDHKSLFKKSKLEADWLFEVINGKWFEKKRNAIQKQFDIIAEQITGEVEYTIEKRRTWLRSVKIM